MFYYERVNQFDTIAVSVDSVDRRRIKGTIDLDGLKFIMYFDYTQDVDIDYDLAGMIMTMPVINYAYFAKRIKLNFPVSLSFLKLVKEFIRINNIETFINSIVRRRYEFFLKEYLPSDEEITQENAEGRTEVLADISDGDKKKLEVDDRKVIVLSSGGKESLLTFGILKEIGAVVYPVFFNESGAHWKTAKVAYDYFSSKYENVLRVWSNVDRFYSFVNRHLKILDQDEIRRKADSYPVQMFIFPVYIFSVLPYVIKYGIGNIALGDELDDPIYEEPYHGIKHYYGVYDQTNDFNLTLTSFLREYGIHCKVFSAVYPIFGTLVEKILVQRYNDLFRVQRSCHLCHYEGGDVKPCGTCSKCLGVLLFMLNAEADPTEAGYSIEHVKQLEDNVNSASMRLDPDELEYLKAKVFEGRRINSHIEGIHQLPGENSAFSLVPERFRDGVRSIVSKYSTGFYKFVGSEWVKID
ncbi:hypothetical protein [Thermoplasma volcanium GSS1]|uniref:Uncharacterized protein n=1 Tax=Thermoplasma volcanium (strain ATCC 51530 / DSM 4299 / JCM 9571 / NBRC 15438 / GSS1) TaxID=273116 RepID=Q97CM9_THEVO|nr:hypothetical protein [Thermoplasma volcanium]BAB59214.1 hypothetical protein [Thermoplasma volcanium GSS1]